MDINNTRFQLIKDEPEWTIACREENGSSGRLVQWDPRTESLTLSPQLLLFHHGMPDVPLDPSERRGAAVDRFGNWYWIANDRRRIFWLPSGSRRSAVYWTQPSPLAPRPGEFGSVSPPHTEDELAGLTVTEHHYLVAGNVSRHGLFLFDLHSGGAPLLLLFPEEIEPFDMAPAPGGGVWILDRKKHGGNYAYWGLDRNFQVLTEESFQHDLGADKGSAFQPADGVARLCRSHQSPKGFPVAAQNPISIEALPDGSVLILDTPDQSSPPDLNPAPSTLYHYRLDKQVSEPLALAADVDVVVAGTEEQLHRLTVAGYDIAYTPGKKTLYVVEHDGKQTIAFCVDFSSPQSPPKALRVNPDWYLPMHSFGRRALVSHDGKVFYDVGSTDISNDAVLRWLQLLPVDQPRYERLAVLLTPVFDGKERDCVWDRLFLDACIPPETNVQVSTRALNDQQLLETAPFTPEPNLYLRGSGSEIPYYYSFAGLEVLPAGAGTWELLFQQARGRYCQIRLELTGNGRVTPQLRALRAYYPRFSYPRRYLPALYLEDQESASFLERLLANPGSMLAELEGKMNDVTVLFDPRSAPAEALDWLAGWVGLVLDPLWARIQERRSNAANGQPRQAIDRRRLFIRYALRLYERRGSPDGIKFALHLLLDPCLETMLQRFKAATVRLNPGLRDDLARLGLPYPTPTMTEEQFEDLLHDYVLSPERPSKVRLVESFLARQGRSAVAGDVTTINDTGSVPETIKASAHLFSVLVPEGLSSEEEAMVQRIVKLEKPAHTDFDVRRYWDYFRVGEARLGLDTVLGEESRFVPMILGRNHLADSYLYPNYPMDVRERVISDRDRTDAMPPL